jgi:hypothetical protein
MISAHHCGVVFVAGGNAILKPQASDQVAAFALK